MPIESVAAGLAIGLAKSVVTSKIKNYLARFPDPNTEGFKLAREECSIIGSSNFGSRPSDGSPM